MILNIVLQTRKLYYRLTNLKYYPKIITFYYFEEIDWNHFAIGLDNLLKYLFS
jgi:hypothetical protein